MMTATLLVSLSLADTNYIHKAVEMDMAYHNAYHSFIIKKANFTECKISPKGCTFPEVGIQSTDYTFKAKDLPSANYKTKVKIDQNVEFKYTLLNGSLLKYTKSQIQTNSAYDDILTLNSNHNLMSVTLNYPKFEPNKKEANNQTPVNKDVKNTTQTTPPKDNIKIKGEDIKTTMYYWFEKKSKLNSICLVDVKVDNQYFVYDCDAFMKRYNQFNSQK